MKLPFLNRSVRIAQWDTIQRQKHWSMQTNARLVRKVNGVLHQVQPKIPCATIANLENMEVILQVLLLKVRVATAVLEDF